MRLVYLGCAIGAICVLVFVIVRTNWRILRDRELMQSLENKQEHLARLLEEKSSVLSERELIAPVETQRSKRSTDNDLQPRRRRRFQIVARKVS